MWFHIIPDARALLSSRGVFKQVDVYRGPNRRLFAKWGGGFIRLGGLSTPSTPGSTSLPGVVLDAVDLPFVPELDDLKRLLVPEHVLVATKEGE